MSRLSNSKDKESSKIIQNTQFQWPKNNTDNKQSLFFNRKYELSVERGCLVWGAQVIILPVLRVRERVLKHLHESHPSITRMKNLAKSYFWWSNMDKFIEDFVNSCEQCQINHDMPP